MQYIINTPNNLIASSLVIRFWFDKAGYEGPAANSALYVAAILVAIVAINFFGVGIFGEFEFVLSSLKVIIMLGLIFFTFALAVGGSSSISAPGFKYWVNPGAFAPFLTCKCQSSTSSSF
jgi:amino acid transporter